MIRQVGKSFAIFRQISKAFNCILGAKIASYPQISTKVLIIMLLCLLSPLAACTQTPPAPPIDSEDPRLKWEYSTPTELPLTALQDKQGKPYLYVAQKDGGLLILDISSSNTPPTIVSSIPTSQLEQLDSMNLTQQGNFLFLALGDFFPATGSKAGLAIVDVQNPLKPAILSIWTSEKVLAGSSGVLIAGDFAYLAAMQEGVFIFDIANKSKIKFISAILPDVDFPKANPNAIEHPNARGLAIKDELLFVVNDAGGLRVIDVKDKSKPKEIAKYINNQMLGKGQAYNNIIINGTQAYIAVDYCGMEILNIQDPSNIQQLGWWNPWACDTNTNIWFGSPGHTNQLVLDASKKLVFLSAGDSELQVVDVTNPQQPTLSSSFGKPSNKQAVWGVSATNDTIYLTYVKAVIPFVGQWSGIKAIQR